MKENDKITCTQMDENGYLIPGKKYTVQYTIIDLTFGQKVYVKEFDNTVGVDHVGSFPVGLFEEGRKIKIRGN